MGKFKRSKFTRKNESVVEEQDQQTKVYNVESPREALFEALEFDEILKRRISWHAVGNTYFGYLGRWKIFKIEATKVTNSLPGFKAVFECEDSSQGKASCEAIWVRWTKGLEEEP